MCHSFLSLLTGYSQTQNMFLPRLSFPHKPNSKPLASEQQEFSTGDTDEEQFDYSEDEEENQTGFKSTLEDCSAAGDEDLKLNEEQSDDLTAATSSSNNCIPIEFPYSFDFVYLFD